MRYPRECPAFEYKGKVYEGRPRWGTFDDKCGPELTLVGSNGNIWHACVENYVTPLTPAARAMLAWCKGTL